MKIYYAGSEQQNHILTGVARGDYSYHRAQRKALVKNMRCILFSYFYTQKTYVTLVKKLIDRDKE